MRHLRLATYAVGALAALLVAGASSASGLTLSEQDLATLAWQGGGQAYIHSKDSCSSSRDLCTEVRNPEEIWGYHYVGHDEPAVLFSSKKPGSGNDMTYQIQIPREPKGAYSYHKSYDFELGPAFWFGMALCDNYSYPQTVKTCKPDSDSNAVNVAKSIKHPGAAYMELQFYPPGWVPQFAAQACDPTKWCAALTTDSLSANPITGTQLNASCQSRILGGTEYGNFAYLTRNGLPQGPPNPLEFDPVASGQPGPHVLYMKQGDKLTLYMHDSPHGLVTKIIDHTSGQSGFMTASAANDFGHIAPAPTGTHCHLQYYDFHPMYSTSQPTTTVPWAAATYNVAVVDELGHFDFCTHINANSPEESCDGLEGPPGHRSPADADDNFCFSAEESLFYPVTGCTDANDPGFDGPSYVKDWPGDGKASRHPTPFYFSSPTTHGAAYTTVAFNTDLPSIETPDIGGKCNVRTGTGCTNPPPTDQHKPAFYPYFSTVSTKGGCRWAIGDLAGRSGTTDSFGGSSKAEFGPLQPSVSWVNKGGGATETDLLDYQRTLSGNPC